MPRRRGLGFFLLGLGAAVSFDGGDIAGSGFYRDAVFRLVRFFEDFAEFDCVVVLIPVGNLLLIFVVVGESRALDLSAIAVGDRGDRSVGHIVGESRVDISNSDSGCDQDEDGKERRKLEGSSDGCEGFTENREREG